MLVLHSPFTKVDDHRLLLNYYGFTIPLLRMTMNYYDKLSYYYYKCIKTSKYLKNQRNLRKKKNIYKGLNLIFLQHH